MTRIIAGSAGGTVLAVPPAGTRPTSDRVRESLFAALESADAITGAAVLDLYAGTGALGLEALSRGATHVDLVERAPTAARTAQANAAKVSRALAGAGRAQVHRRSTLGFLAGRPGPYDLVLVDPPYAVTEDEVAAVLAHLAGCVAPGGLIVLERAARSPQPHPPTGMELERHRRYGDTALWWLRREDGDVAG